MLLKKCSCKINRNKAKNGSIFFWDIATEIIIEEKN